jgi:hypothetical protein
MKKVLLAFLLTPFLLGSFILMAQSVGIGISNPLAKLHVAGNVKVDGPNTIELGAGLTKEINAGKIGYQSFSAGLDIVGAGTLQSNRKITFWNEGGAEFRGSVGIGITSPISEAHIVHGFGSISHGLRINHVSASGNFWNLYTQSTGDLELATGGGIKGIFRASDGVYTPSDRGLKKNFEPVQDILHKIMKLDVQKYNFTQENEQSPKHYGMMAQDVVNLFPEIVLHSKFDGEKDTWLMNYSAFGVLAIKAIQQQQLIIDEQKKRNDAQEEEIAALKERTNKLEAVLASITAK